MTKPLNVEAPEFTPPRKVSKTTRQQASEAPEYYPASLLREAVSIVNEKLKLEKKVDCKAAIREDKRELPRPISSDLSLRLPCERALIGGELFDQIFDVESEGGAEGGAGRNGDFPLRGMVGGATIRTVIQQRKVREILFILGVCRIRTAFRQQTGVSVGVEETLLEEDQFYAGENYRLRQRVEPMMQEILQLRLEMGKLLELISEMKTEIRQMGENSERNNNQRMTMVSPPATTTAHYQIASPTNWPRSAGGNPPLPTPMVGHLLNRRRLRDKF